MKCYAVAGLAITHPGWIAQYVAQVTPLVEARGGRFLARTPKVQKIEGERPAPQVVLIIQWPSRAVAEEFYASEEYRPHLEARRAGSTGEFVLVAGEDVNGVADVP
ncbi:MAG TPA: DUF1330 domain-containing protein [Solirubrobacteraceae bacterium]|jgi:uncharacterized protein (DUF1330 family)